MTVSCSPGFRELAESNRWPEGMSHARELPINLFRLLKATQAGEQSKFAWWDFGLTAGGWGVLRETLPSLRSARGRCFAFRDREAFVGVEVRLFQELLGLPLLVYSADLDVGRGGSIIKVELTCG